MKNAEFNSLFEIVEDDTLYSSSLIPKDRFEDPSAKEIALLSFQLGWISFGTAKTRIELFKDILQKRRNYISPEAFKNLLDLCLLLPGYSSSIFLCGLITINKKSIPHGLLALFCYNLPSLFLVVAFAMLFAFLRITLRPDVLNYDPNIKYFNFYDNVYIFSLWGIVAGITQASIALLIDSTINVMNKLSSNNHQFMLVSISFLLFFIQNDYYFMLIIMIACGIISIIYIEQNYLYDIVVHSEYNVFHGIKGTGKPCFIIYLIILMVLFGLNQVSNNTFIFLLLTWFQTASVSIGEGNVIIPVIYIEFAKMVEESEILNGYALVKFLPGSLLNIAGYIGTTTNGLFAGIISGILIFLPGLLFMYGSFPYFENVKNSQKFQSFISGTNSAGIGFIMASILKLWYDSCAVNGYTNAYLGSINIFLCFFICANLDIHKTLILFIGAIINFIGITILSVFGKA